MNLITPSPCFGLPETPAKINIRAAVKYWLADAAGKLLRKYRGDYVPDRLLCVGDRGYGDCIIFNAKEVA